MRKQILSLLVENTAGGELATLDENGEMITSVFKNDLIIKR